jgi:hypothetical protein
MDELVRTCSASEAAVLAGAAGRCARVGAAWLCVREPAAAGGIDPAGTARYLARVAVLGSGPDPGAPAPADAARVLSQLFGAYVS